MISERSFLAQRFARIDVAFDNKVRIGRNFEVAGLAFYEFDRFFAQVAREQEFIESIGQRRGGGKRKDGIAAKKDRDRHASARLVIPASVACADFLKLPVHACALQVIDLDAIHSDVALTGIGVLSDHARQRNKTSAIERPALENG